MDSNSSTRNSSGSVHLTDELGAMKGELTCTICLDVFNDPVTLPCLHNFCRGCIRQVGRPSRGHRSAAMRVQCPNCRNEATVDVSELPTNFTINNIIEWQRELCKKMERTGREGRRSHPQDSAGPATIASESRPGAEGLPGGTEGPRGSQSLGSHSQVADAQKPCPEGSPARGRWESVLCSQCPFPGVVRCLVCQKRFCLACQSRHSHKDDEVASATSAEGGADWQTEQGQQQPRPQQHSPSLQHQQGHREQQQVQQQIQQQLQELQRRLEWLQQQIQEKQWLQMWRWKEQQKLLQQRIREEQCMQLLQPQQHQRRLVWLQKELQELQQQEQLQQQQLEWLQFEEKQVQLQLQWLQQEQEQRRRLECIMQQMRSLELQQPFEFQTAELASHPHAPSLQHQQQQQEEAQLPAGGRLTALEPAQEPTCAFCNIPGVTHCNTCEKNLCWQCMEQLHNPKSEQYANHHMVEFIASLGPEDEPPIIPNKVD